MMMGRTLGKKGEEGGGWLPWSGMPKRVIPAIFLAKSQEKGAQIGGNFPRNCDGNPWRGR